MAGHVEPCSPPTQSSHYHHHGHTNCWVWIKSCRVWNKIFKISTLTVLYFVQNWEKGDFFLPLRFRDHRSLMLSGPSSHLWTVKIAQSLWKDCLDLVRFHHMLEINDMMFVPVSFFILSCRGTLLNLANRNLLLHLCLISQTWCIVPWLRA